MKIDSIPYTCAVCLLLSCASSVLAKSEIPIKVVNEMIQSGAMTMQDYHHLKDIHMKIENGGKVTDDDLDFVINYLETDPPNPRETLFHRIITVVYAVWGYHHWTLKQKASLLQSAVWLLSQPEPRNQLINGNATDKTPALDLLYCVHDKRVLPYVRKLEKDPDPQVAAKATKLYNSITGGKK